MCTDAYREALTRDLSSTASSAPASTPAPSQRQAAEAGLEGVAGRPLRRRTNPGQDDLESRRWPQAQHSGCTWKQGKGDHIKWHCPCGNHIAVVTRGGSVSPGVVADTIGKLACLPKGWLQ